MKNCKSCNQNLSGKEEERMKLRMLCKNNNCMNIQADLGSGFRFSRVSLTRPTGDLNHFFYLSATLNVKAWLELSDEALQAQSEIKLS